MGNQFMADQGNMFSSIFKNKDYLTKLAQAAAGSQYDPAVTTKVGANKEGLVSGDAAIIDDGPVQTALKNSLSNMASGFTDGLFKKEEVAAGGKTPEEVKTSAINNFTDVGALSSNIDYSKELRNANPTQVASLTPGYLSKSVNINKGETAAMMNKADQFAEGSALGKDLAEGKNAAFDATKGLTPDMSTEGLFVDNRKDQDMLSGTKAFGKSTDWAAVLQAVVKAASA